MKRPDSSLIDRVGIFAASLCGLHCICLPVLLSLTAASGFAHVISEPMEIILIAVSVILGVANLTCSWWKDHHKPECLILFAAGMGFIVLREWASGPVVSIAASVAGAVFITGAHLRNMQLVRRCGCRAGSPCPHNHSVTRENRPFTE